MKSKLTKMLSLTLFIGVLLIPTNLFAQESAAPTDLGKVFHIGVMVFFLFVFAILLTLVAYHDRNDEEMPTIVKMWRWLSHKMNKSTPIEKEDSIVLSHNYDGIRELDNVLPPWWSYLFYVTIVFSIVYMLNYHVINVWPLSDSEYQEEVKLADEQIQILVGSGALINENTVTELTDPASISVGAEIFKKNCVSCHGINGQGNIGPNLTDEYWINGGGVKNVYKTISNGVLAKGMLSWKSQLKGKEMQQVASYVLSLKGSNPANAKAPQGTVWGNAAKPDSAQAKNESIKTL